MTLAEVGFTQSDCGGCAMLEWWKDWETSSRFISIGPAFIPTSFVVNTGAEQASWRTTGASLCRHPKKMQFTEWGD